MEVTRKKIGMIVVDIGERLASGARSRALKSFLESNGYQVTVISPSKKRLKEYASPRLSLANRICREILKRPYRKEYYWDFVSDEVEPQIREGNFDVLIGREQPGAYVLRKDFNCLKIFDMANISYIEKYYGGSEKLEIEKQYIREREIFENVDYIICQHRRLEEFFKEYVYNSKRVQVLTVRLGCYLTDRRAQYREPIKFVYAGDDSPANDPMLLAYLTRISPFEIDYYGGKDSNWSFYPAKLNYKGYDSTLDSLSNYQFGLITVSKDFLRQYSPSTKFAYYFAHGLPVFFPEWMKEGYDYKGCVPYNEYNFVEITRKYANRAIWEKMHEQVIEQAKELTWDKVLQPLLKLIENSLTQSCADITSGIAATGDRNQRTEKPRTRNKEQ